MFSGNSKIIANDRQPEGRFVNIDGEQFYQIADYDGMQPFFISLASDTDLWMYIASTGGLTAGRVSPDRALFPYYTDDKIIEQSEVTGPKTIMHVMRGGRTFLWEPFSDRQQGVYHLRRTIAKNTVGNKLLFTETNLDLGLTFLYQWCASAQHGWVRKARLVNNLDTECSVEIIDGLQNLLPSGIDRLTQNTYSTLVDGYKKTELVEGTSLVLLRMEAILVDRAEPSESLRCNTVYCVGMPEAENLVSSRQLNAFRRGQAVTAEPEAKGVRGAIFAHATLNLKPAKAASEDHMRTWYFVADTAKDAVQVRETIKSLASAGLQLAAEIESGMARSRQALCDIVGQNDGIQHTADKHDMARHFANTLFNTMRGGFYCNDYKINGKAFRHHVEIFNKAVAARHAKFLGSLPEEVEYGELMGKVVALGDEQLHRLALEYLPLTFSRRHGDPSRPWNLFNIRVNDEQGNRIISYQGNWRDIFQNWEALSLSYPGYINGIIAKFLNATTVDGYNPYKITSEGIDWEVIEPDNPWSNIGYWGDHQIVYLLKLLELSYAHDPKALTGMLCERLFAFANVPYRLKSYAEIEADPKNSIRFDDKLHSSILADIPVYGQDARLVRDSDGNVTLATLTEKLLITLLTKLSNFIPDAGIWMNTLRPEWNDANNALVGYGASMVTLCYMRRYVGFLRKIYENCGTQNLYAGTAEFFHAVVQAMKKYAAELLDGNPYDNDHSRYFFTEAVGKAGEQYRQRSYSDTARQDMATLDAAHLQEFFDLAARYIDKSIANNKRSDGLYNAYNLIEIQGDQIFVESLYPMLEGQVAVLTSFALTPAEVADLLDVMPKSGLYRADQRSYMLYPAKRLPSFLEKNNVDPEIARSPLVQRLLKEHRGVIFDEDCNGTVHFNADFNNAGFLSAAIERHNINVTANERQALLCIYEHTFNHHAFTGRSGTFYKYEGLGCIYWHMVSKLLLAVGENISHAVSVKAEDKTVARLIAHYRAIREGIGSHKTPQQYGSFPFDAYSHTPSMMGVQQPGMTGQVKEDIINRFFELGVTVRNGEICLDGLMLREEDFSDGRLDFTYCAVTFEYNLKNYNRKGNCATGKEECGRPVSSITVSFADGKQRVISGSVIPRDIASHIFARDMKVSRVTVEL